MRSLAVVACLLASPAIAAPKCVPLEKLQHAQKPGTTAAPVTRAQYHFLQGVSAAMPNTPPGIPPGDNAILITRDDARNGFIIWTMGPLACGSMEAPAELLKLLDQIKTGDDGEGL